MSHPRAQSVSVNEANCRLHTLRAALRAERAAQPQLHTQSTMSNTSSSADCVLPTHLGWGVMRANVQAKTQPATPPHNSFPSFKQPNPENIESLPTIVRAYPSLLTAMLRQERAAIGRIWLLCRALDQEGQGWLRIDVLRQKLADKTSNWHIVGWRRLRQLLQAGKGVFWERDEFGRIWLYSAARVAQNLNVSRLAGNPVELPIAELLEGIHSTKAVFYAAFHTGRKTSNPISRATLRELTGSAEATQRTYEASSNITAHANYCISGIRSTTENVQAEAFKRAAVFTVTDRKTGQQQIAWPLPNNYKTTLQTACRGRQRKINRQLKLSSDLVIQGRGGTDEDFGRIFCANGKQALQRSSQLDRYWRDHSNQWRQTSSSRI